MLLGVNVFAIECMLASSFNVHLNEIFCLHDLKRNTLNLMHFHYVHVHVFYNILYYVQIYVQLI